MSFYLEETCNIPFDFAYAKLAEDVIAFCLSHENFPYEAEVNLTLTDNEEIHRIDLTASVMCMENHIPMYVFGLGETNSIVNAVNGQFNGTVVTVD